MDFDLTLAKSLKFDEAVLRLYQWEPYCMSLGANQSEKTLSIKKISDDNIDIVKRPTGGRAILHAEELTYSVIYHIGTELSPKDLFREINIALVKGLISYDDALKNLELHNSQPNFPSFYNEDKSAVCFSVSSKNEINFAGKKLVGSAQRRIGNVVLQHGSILCGSYHKNICSYLDLPADISSELKEEMDKTTTDLNEILNKTIDITELASSIKNGFTKHFEIKRINYQKDFEPASTMN
ncbi:MAG: lipoate--protein ligase family protein [Ignavibacterium sp.]|nr:MAG: lipoate--protein ligase family protein [Ignavibacterium sp.]